MTTAPSVQNADSGYIFDNSTTEAARQVRLLAEILDRHTTAVLGGLDVQPGWHCLELGAGRGSITGWLADRVGPTGRVVAMDQNPQHVPDGDVVDIRTVDITTADLGAGEYDLVHARLLLMHLPNREEIVRRIAGALKPGGVVVISDWDVTHLDEMLLRGPDGVAGPFLAFQEAVIAELLDNGVSLDWARWTPLAMYDAGLTDIETETYNRVWAGGEAGNLLHETNSRQLEPMLLRRGMTAEHLAVLRDGMGDPSVLAWSYPMVTSIGRRPAG